MLKARLDIAVNLGARVDVLDRLGARTDLIMPLKGEVGPMYMYGAVYFPLDGDLVSNCGKYVMTFSRNSIAYDSKGSRVEVNVPRWEEV